MKMSVDIFFRGAHIYELRFGRSGYFRLKIGYAKYVAVFLRIARNMEYRNNGNQQD